MRMSVSPDIAGAHLQGSTKPMNALGRRIAVAHRRHVMVQRGMQPVDHGSRHDVVGHSTAADPAGEFGIERFAHAANSRRIASVCWPKAGTGFGFSSGCSAEAAASNGPPGESTLMRCNAG